MAMTTRNVERLRTGLRVLLAIVFFGVGVWHLTLPPDMLKITPDWVPDKKLVILATGCCELAGSIALFVPRLRWLAGVMFALYCVCVYPANVNHAILHARTGMPPGWGYHVPRLLFQPVFVWWSLFAGGAIDWPWRRR